ncbi:uncharacterized protein AC631_03330 [Debaryomyces fabryi]|uniref:Calcium/proton exchanger n=1 Tax=Debaryomyces fabryi TaxID=58627 RepID=A0A0V1PX91_9ASCO|nr:uncharacterized protein AC631_03330 [Debaryomyces fabryi]KSA00900.1 hypothetical protein AC631_03330 [Debaryomyces fabryi]CUM51787.1 unnamed protein product [Debaryomyces fabryi]
MSDPQPSSSNNGKQPMRKNDPIVEQSEGTRKTSISSISNSPSLNPRSLSKSRRRSKQHLRRPAPGGSASQKLIFSVDDDPGEKENVEAIKNKGKLEREYLEGYNDALKALYLKRSRYIVNQDPNTSYTPVYDRDTSENQTEVDDMLKSTNDAENIHSFKSANIESNLINSIISAKENLKLLKFLENSKDNEPPIDQVLGDEGEGSGSNDDDDESIKSGSSIESLNLRERQDAINSTHPFGIKIWKPSLYKKKRSVAARAEEDIHDYDSHESTYRIFWGVYVCNFVWSITFGLALFALCLVGAFVVFILSGFAINRQLRPYVKLLVKLGKYWLSPFGKFVLLTKDKNYLDEDQLEGRTISEYQKWREQEEGRLFFAPPRRYTNANNESAPLLKDHKGRPLSDAYSSLGTADSSANALEDPFESDDEEGQDLELGDIKKRFFGRGSWSSGRFMFYLYFYVILQPIIWTVGIICWFFVFTIPIANVANILCDHLRRHPLALHFELEKEYYANIANKDTRNKRKHQLIILCTYRCCGLHYYKYTIDGTNVFFYNLLAAVIFVIFDYFVLKEKFGWETWFTDSSFLFCACLFSIIPLAYFIGQAVASISAQSSMGLGAVINAFFSTIVEIFLYCVALNQSKGKLVEGSMIGSILGGVLLLPGLSMCGGALKRKTQRYNPRSAGVSSTMLLFAMVTMFAPSLFYQIYGSYDVMCKKCDTKLDLVDAGDCTKCRFVQPSFTLDTLYYAIIKPFSMIVATALFSAYVCGLFFTLRTHASLIWATNSHEQAVLNKRDDYFRSPSMVSLDPSLQLKSGKPQLKQVNLSPSISAAYSSGVDSHKPNSASKTLLTQSPSLDANKSRQTVSRNNSAMGNVNKQKAANDNETGIKNANKDAESEIEGNVGHNAANWSRNKSAIILLGATLLYAVIAEILVDNVDAVLSDFPINPKFLGLTVFALVPNTTEFLNAISFAIGGNVALSMEIGSAYALQVVLIQIPSLVLYSIYKGFDDVEKIFSLVFPRWDIIATLISIYLFTYIYAEGKSNYFKGVILILIYAVVLMGFWYNDKIEDLNDGYTNKPEQPGGGIFW